MSRTDDEYEDPRERLLAEGIQMGVSAGFLLGVLLTAALGYWIVASAPARCQGAEMTVESAIAPAAR